MSFIERALEKMQASGGARKPKVGGAADADVSFGKVVAQARPSVAPAKRLMGNPDRIVKVDLDGLRKCGLLPPPDQEREIADQYRAIKRPLIRTAFQSPPPEGPPPQLIMIASALAGDGKTFTGINLALSMAREKDHAVLLVDGDVTKPNVSRQFGVEKEPGLLDLLTGPTRDVHSVLLRTDVPGLTLLPAGTPQDNATELLASERMAEITRLLASLDPTGVVLFDSLPILQTSEARVLTTLAGQVILVVKAGQTPQQAVMQALEVIGPEKNVRLILNQAPLSDPLSYYHSYRYGYQPLPPDEQEPPSGS